MNLNELKKQSLSDENFISQIVYKIKNPDTRSDFFKVISSIGSHWQENPTPLDIIRKMTGKTSLDNKKILVLFNIEFLQVLIEEKNIKPENIYYVADNKLEYLCGSKIFKVQSYHLKEHNVASLKQQITGLNMKFDLVFSNPPYNDYIDIKILNEIISNTKECIIVHPSAYILKDGGDNSTINKFNSLIDNKVSSIHFIDPYITFDGVLNPTPCVVTHYDENYSGDINVSYEFSSFFNINDVSYQAKSVEDITIYGSKYQDYILPFKMEIEKYCTKHGSLNKIKQNKINYSPDKFYCQLPQIIGQVNRTKNFKGFYEHTFFTLMPLNEMTDVVFENGVPKSSKKNNFVFDTEDELINFKNYLKTDFVRFCLSFKKFSKNLQTDSFNLIPLLDFKQPWDDERLYDYFNVSKDTILIIQEFIPDCYKIRK